MKKFVSIDINLSENDLFKYDVFLTKINNTYLVGPKITDDLDIVSLKRRYFSSALYETFITKKISLEKGNKIIDKYFAQLEENEVIEIKKNRIIEKYKILTVSGVYFEK